VGVSIFLGFLSPMALQWMETSVFSLLFLMWPDGGQWQWLVVAPGSPGRKSRYYGFLLFPFFFPILFPIFSLSATTPLSLTKVELGFVAKGSHWFSAGGEWPWTLVLGPHEFFSHLRLMGMRMRIEEGD